MATTANSTTGSTASYEDGDGSSSIADDEDEVQAIIEQLSSVQSPQISEVTSRSALLKWTAPVASPSATENVVLNLRDLRYEVLLSDRGKEGKYKIIFKGQSLTCRIRDLRPGQEYSVCLQVKINVQFQIRFLDYTLTYKLSTGVLGGNPGKRFGCGHLHNARLRARRAITAQSYCQN